MTGFLVFIAVVAGAYAGYKTTVAKHGKKINADDDVTWFITHEKLTAQGVDKPLSYC